MFEYGWKLFFNQTFQKIRIVASVALVFTAMSGTAWAIPTPEMDPGSAVAALTLFGGGLLLLLPRVSQRATPSQSE